MCAGPVSSVTNIARRVITAPVGSVVTPHRLGIQHLHFGMHYPQWCVDLTEQDDRPTQHRLKPECGFGETVQRPAAGAVTSHRAKPDPGGEHRKQIIGAWWSAGQAEIETVVDQFRFKKRVIASMRSVSLPVNGQGSATSSSPCGSPSRMKPAVCLAPSISTKGCCSPRPCIWIARSNAFFAPAGRTRLLRRDRTTARLCRTLKREHPIDVRTAIRKFSEHGQGDQGDFRIR